MSKKQIAFPDPLFVFHDPMMSFHDPMIADRNPLFAVFDFKKVWIEKPSCGIYCIHCTDLPFYFFPLGYDYYLN
jgi:hypothetical protein